ncbi:MAG: hypothetical protein MUQ25_12895 [Candidatus Aminicenantes bacterium]|jgi:hypothetical protein|nr:hypothetical protein [Candidatus Aminicenantes bacterium]
MKFRTKLAILVVAAILSLAGFGLITDGLSVDKIITAHNPGTSVTVHVTSYRILT